MNISEETLRKFSTCFSTFEYSGKDETYFTDQGIDILKFKKLMYKFRMEEYTLLTLDYCYNYESNIPKGRVKERIDNSIRANNELNYEIDLIKALIFFSDDKQGNSTSLTAYRSKGSLSITNKELIKTIHNALIQDYEKRDLLSPLYEAKSEEVNIFLDQLNQSLDFLSYYYSEPNPTAGRKEKNTFAGYIAYDLSYLIRLDRFLDDRTGIKSVDEIPLTKNDCFFIHDVLVFFNIIDDYSQNKITTTKPQHYIRALLHQADSKILQYGIKDFSELSDLKKPYQKANTE